MASPPTESVNTPSSGRSSTRKSATRRGNAKNPTSTRTEPAKFAGYATYNFVDKDPVIDAVRTLIADEGVTYKYIETKSGVTTTTLRAWFGGSTRRPQYATIRAVVGALGYEMTFTKAVPHD